MTTRKQEQEQNLIDIRRARITELLAKGYVSQVEISRILNVSEPTVSRDIIFLKQQAQQNLKEHLELRIPLQYSICETGLKIILRKAFDIVNNHNNTTAEIIQSLNLIANIYGRLMELATDEKTIAQAVSWIEKKKQQLMQELQKEVQETEQEQEQPDFTDSEQEIEGESEEFQEENADRE
jgi:uncharacterized membrane protein